MCEAVAIAAIAVGATTAIAGHDAATTQARAQARNNAALAKYRNQKVLNEMDYQRQVYAANQERYFKVGESAQKNAQKQYQDALTNIDQSLAASYGRIKQFARVTAKNRSTVMAAAAESGVGGLSVDEALAEFEIAESSNALNESVNMKNYIAQQFRTMETIQANAQMAADSATPQPLAPIQAPQPVPTVVGPSPLTAIAQGASSALSIYAAGGGFDEAPDANILGVPPTALAGYDPASGVIQG